MSFWRRLLGGSERAVPGPLSDEEMMHRLQELGLEPGEQTLDMSRWPENRDRRLFDSWFRVRVHLDLVDLRKEGNLL